jgi:hypothetical protein
MVPRGRSYTESMACSSRTAVATLSFVVGLAGVTACGHFGVEIGFSGDDSDSGTNEDGGGDDGSISADGASDASADARDAGPPIPCTGPSCPGVYVAGDVGNDNDPGTSDKPVATIAKGIELASQRGKPTDVYVAAKANSGKYNDPLTFIEGVSLYGGYDCTAAPCSWARDFQKNVTLIAGTDYRGLVIGDEISRVTVIDGFQIFGKGTSPNVAPGGVALTIEGAPTVRNCKVEASPATSGTQGSVRSIAVAIIGPSSKDPNGPLIEKNDIRAAQANEESVGIWMAVRVGAGTAATVAAEITHNAAIRGGAGVRSYGIFARRTAAATLVDGNNITSGPSGSVGSEGGSWGIVAGGQMTIRRNQINQSAAVANTSGPSCAGEAWCGGIRSDQGALVIESNIIKGVRGGNTAAVILVGVEGANPPAVALNGNTLDPVGDGSDTGSTSAAIQLQNDSLFDVTIGKVRNNILLGGVNATRYGVYESKTGKQIHLAALENNDFFLTPRQDPSGDFAYFYWNGSAATQYTFAQLASVQTPSPNANISVNPKLDPATYLLQSGSPVVDKGTLTEAPKRDIKGDTRPKGSAIDLGAHELQ